MKAVPIIKYNAMNKYGEVVVYIHTFLTPELHGVQWSSSRHCQFTPGERDPDGHWYIRPEEPHSQSGRCWENKYLLL
jgi:hypothetical protein